jgi:hypothetical protein
MCETSTLKSIKRNCQVINAPRLKPEIFLAYEEELIDIPAPASGKKLTITEDITLRPANANTNPVTPVGTWKKLETALKGTKFDVTPLGDPENPSGFKTEFEYRVNRISDVYSESLVGLDASPMVGVVQDMNGQGRIVGEIGNPCYIQVKEVISDTDNHYEVKGTWEISNHRPYFYKGALVA